MVFAASEHNYVAPFYVQVMFRDSDGYPMGTSTDPDNIVANTTTSALVVDGIIDYTAAVIDNPVVTDFGSQKVASKTYLPAVAYGTPTIKFSRMNETFWAYTKTALVDVTTNTTRSSRGDNVSQTRFPPFMVALAIRVTNADTGMPQWDNICYLNARIRNTVSPGASAVMSSVVNPNPLQFGLELALATRDITGMLLSAMNLDVENDLDAVIRHRSDNPLAYTTWIANGAATTFTLGKLPVSAGATGAAQNFITKNGAVTAVTSVSITTGAVVVAAAGTTGDIWCVAYETQKLGA